MIGSSEDGRVAHVTDSRGSPLLVKLLADDLSALAGAPSLSHRAQLWCGRHYRDGRRELWEVSGAQGVTTVVGYLREPGSPWERRQRSALGMEFLDAVRHLTDLFELSPNVITRFVLGPDSPAAAGDLVEAMSVSEAITTASEWPDWIDVPWPDDVDIDTFYPDIEWRHVWAMIDDLRVTALRTTIDGDVLIVPVLMDLDPSDVPEWHAIEVILERSWINEGGGAPVTWQGWNSVKRLNGRVAVGSQRGDDGREDSLLVLPVLKKRRL